MPGARSIIRSAIMIRFCTCVISLVRRVTREPVENRSISENEKVWICLNASFRSPVPKLIAATDANHAPPTPPAKFPFHAQFRSGNSSDDDLSASKAGADSDRLPYDSPFFQYNGAAADPCVETEMTACLPVSDSRSASHFVLVPSHFPLVN